MNEILARYLPKSTAFLSILFSQHAHMLAFLQYLYHRLNFYRRQLVIINPQLAIQHNDTLFLVAALKMGRFPYAALLRFISPTAEKPGALVPLPSECTG